MSDKKLILTIDDDPDILDSIKAILTAEGFDVLTAATADEGLKEIKTSKPDLVLCDMMMEQVDTGTKIAQEIRSFNKTIPVYLLSSIGNATSSNIDVDSLGFNGVIQKPVSPELLVNIIKKSLKL